MRNKGIVYLSREDIREPYARLWRNMCVDFGIYNGNINVLQQFAAANIAGRIIELRHCMATDLCRSLQVVY